MKEYTFADFFTAETLNRYIMTEDEKRMYTGHWSPEKLLSTGKPLNLSIGSRGIGKSTGLGCHFIYDYYKTGNKFIYVRRTDDELKRTKKDYFSTPQDIYNETYGTAHTIEYCRDDTYQNENGEILGYALPLSLADKYKSAHFGDLGAFNVLYDEFIVRRGLEKNYLGSEKDPNAEYRLLIGLYQTTDRKKGHAYLNKCKIFCLGNFATLFNPILNECHIDEYVDKSTHFANPKTQPWAIEFTDFSALDGLDMRKSFGYWLSPEEDRASDYENDGFVKAENIQKLSGHRLKLMNVSYRGRKYGIWQYDQLGLVYVTHELCPTSRIIALTMGDSGKINQLTAINYRYSPEMDMLRQAAANGFLVFENARARTDILTYLDFTL